MTYISLFLGAGASRAFGYPTTREFLEILRKGASRQEGALLESVVSVDLVQDVEHVLQFLDGVLATSSNNYVNAVFSSIRTIFPIKGGETWEAYVRLCKRLKGRIISTLYVQYEFDPVKIDNVVRAYAGLVNLIQKYNAGGSRSRGTLDVFTTNYDRVVEEFALNAKANIHLIDGFSTDSRSGRRLWNPTVFTEPSLNREESLLRLFKLHGSLNWRETSTGEIESVRTEQECRVDSRRYRRNVLIYPTQSLSGQEPFDTLIQNLKKISTNCTTFLVIGYSFRDAYVNEVFIEHLRRNKDKGRDNNLVTVSPNSTKNMDNLFDEGIGRNEREKLNKQIRCIDAEFGKEETLQLISEEL